MMVAEDAMKELGINTHNATLIYSGKFKGYNARVSKRGSEITFRLSKNWKDVAPEIQTGLLQELLCRIFRKKTHTLNMDLYRNFMQKLPDTIAKTETVPVLEESFNRVNNRYFHSLIEKPNLRLSNGTRLLGTYDYGTDTITISQILLQNKKLLDYVMYHELLHKKFRYSSGRKHHKEFKLFEKKFENAEMLERELGRLCRSAGWRRLFGLF